MMAAAIVAVSFSAQAMPLLSGDSTETCVNGAPLGAGPCAITVISPHPAWQPAGAGQWISYADTGHTGATLAPPSGTTPVFSVFEAFSVSGPSTLSLSVWADDTAGVLLNGNLLRPLSGSAPNFTQSTCARGALGCEPREAGIFNAALSAGSHTLEFQVYQVGTGQTPRSNPFGLLYEGSVDLDGPGPAAVPVPMAGALAATGIAGLLLMRGRRTQSHPE